MVDPVVSSKYGKRPLLEMPALQVESDSRVEISSLQDRPKLDFGSVPSLIYRPDGINQQQQQPLGLAPNAGMGVPQPMAMASTLPPPHGGLYSPRPGLPVYQPSPYQHPSMIQPQMVNPPPMRMPPPQHFVDGSGNVIPAMQPPAMYPGVQPPYQGYYPPGGLPPQGVMPQYPCPPPQNPVPENFRLEGVLQYGQLTTLHFRDKTSNFRGLPEFLRAELMKTYGKYPVTDVRIVSMNGEFYIYATPRASEEGDHFSEFDPSNSDSRMIGFNEVRGEPRDFRQVT